MTTPLAALAAAAASLLSAPVGPDVAVGADLRTRAYQHDGKDGTRDNDPVRAFDQRSRVHLDLKHPVGLRAFVELQDVRVWGEEDDTLTDFSAEGLDMHQAYAEIPLGADGLRARVGRQEIILDGQRLLGSVGWTQQARSLDGLRVSWAPPSKSLAATAFYTQVQDRQSVAPGPASNSNTDTVGFGGAHLSLGLLRREANRNSLGLVALLDHSKAADRTRATLGLYDAGAVGALTYRLEGYYQTGALADDPISAWMTGLRVGYALGPVTITLWADVLSGSGDPAKEATESFDTLFATNHKFYGFADFFLSVPADTAGQGLTDVALKLKYTITEGAAVQLDLHRLRLTADRGGDADLGQEVDLVATWSPWAPLKLMAGAFLFVPGPAMTARLGADPDPDLGLYLVSSLSL